MRRTLKYANLFFCLFTTLQDMAKASGFVNAMLTVVALLCLLACHTQANVILTLLDGRQIEMESYQIFYPGKRDLEDFLILQRWDL